MTRRHVHATPQEAAGCILCRAAASHDARDSAPEAGSPTDPGRRAALGLIAAAPAAAAVGSLGGAALLAPRPGLAQTAGASGAAAPPEGRFALRAGWTLVEDDAGAVELIRDAVVVVENGVIAEVRADAPAGLALVEAPGDLLVPGFISGHTHCCSATPTRGIIEGGRSFARPLMLVEDLTDDEMDALTAFNLAELLLSGSTTHVEMSLSLRQAESYVRVARRWGVRGFPGGMIPGISRLFPIWFRADDQVLLDSQAGTLAEIEAELAFARRVMAEDGVMLRPMISPHATDTHTPATMAAMAAAAQELGTGIHIHLAQRQGEVDAVQRLWNTSPARWCAEQGLMDGPFFAAHLSAFDFAEDASVMIERGGVYSHCPSAGGAGGGTQPWPEALGAGMKTNIGIDTHSNDFIENLKLAVLYGQARHGFLAGEGAPPMKRPTIWDAVDGATRVAADGLGRGDLGRIKAGARADLSFIDVSGYLVGTGALPPEPLNNLLYANGKSVRHVMTDGNWQVWNGALTVADMGEVARSGGEATAVIWERLAAEDWFTPTDR